MENRAWNLLEQLQDGSYKSAEALGKALGCSEKTVRNLIRDVNGELRTGGAQIESKQKYGYRLAVADDARWQAFLRQRGEGENIPHTTEERVCYLLWYLLYQKDYVKLTALGDALYVSAQTLSAVLKRVEEIFTEFHLRIDRKPYYGIRAEGGEFDKRCCLIWYLGTEPMLRHRLLPGGKAELPPETSTALQGALRENGLKLTEISFENLTLYLVVSGARIRQGFAIAEAPPDVEPRHQKPYAAARAVWQVMHPPAPDTAPLPEGEIYYAAIYIAGKRTIGSSFKENFVISEKIDYLVMEMLEVVYDTYKIELRDNFNLRMMLNQHLQPLDIRLRYGIPVENPVLYDTKRDYFFAYTMAAQASIVLREHYHQPIPETEIGWLALIFQLAIEKKTVSGKLNLLIVCASGKASSHLLLSKFQKEFGKYIGNLQVCTTFELESQDLKDIDYIFTTVPITKPVDVPILEIHDFMKHYELQTVEKALQRGNLQFLHEFYDARYFFTGIPGDSKEEVLLHICERLQAQGAVPEPFYQAVLKREYLGATDYGNLVAIPHPYKIMTERTVVSVSVLQKPIQWTTNPVQVVILVALSQAENPNTTNFYNTTTRFMTDEQAVATLLAHPDYDTLMQLLYNAGAEEQG